MLTGTCPFVHDNRIDTMHAILHEQPKFRNSGRLLLPLDLQRLLARALNKTPKERHQTIGELAEELKVFKRNLESGKTGAVPTGKLILKRVAAVGSFDGCRLRKRTERSSVQSGDDD